MVAKEDGSRTFWGEKAAARRLPEERIWVTRDGRQIPYGEMDPAHLLNTLLWIRRNAQRKAEKAALEAGVELTSSGWRIRRPPEWDGLLEEARRRGGEVRRIAESVLEDDYDEFELRSAAEVLRKGEPRGM